MTRADIIKRFINQSSAYLEIGVDQGETWEKIDCRRKVGVDPNSGHATHNMTSNEFFEQNKETFDVVFIDGLHIAEQVMDDVNNALNCLNDGGVIIIHDCIPRTMEHATENRIAPEWYGTVWKAAVVLAFCTNLDFVVVDADCGCGILKKGKQKIPKTSMRDAMDPVFFENNMRSIYRIEGVA